MGGGKKSHWFYIKNLINNHQLCCFQANVATISYVMYFISTLLPSLFFLHSLGHSIKYKSKSVTFCSETFSDYLIREAKYLKMASKAPKSLISYLISFFPRAPSLCLSQIYSFLALFQTCQTCSFCLDILFPYISIARFVIFFCGLNEILPSQ